MGLLDFIFDKDKAQVKQVDRLRKKLINIWVQSPDRNYAAEQLRDIGTPEALTALLGRFKVNVKNSTYDNEEKLYIYDMFVLRGAEVIEIVKAFIRNEEVQVNWPMKILDDLLPSDQMAEFIEELLASMSVDYERDPEKKEQMILRAGRFSDFEQVAQQVARFTVDDNENIRFLAVSQVIQQDHPWAIEALRNNLHLEDSGRILRIVCDHLIAKGEVGYVGDADDEIRMRLVERLPREYFIDDENNLHRK